jgi:hypothetical protein
MLYHRILWGLNTHDTYSHTWPKAYIALPSQNLLQHGLPPTPCLDLKERSFCTSMYCPWNLLLPVTKHPSVQHNLGGCIFFTSLTTRGLWGTSYKAISSLWRLFKSNAKPQNRRKIFFSLFLTWIPSVSLQICPSVPHNFLNSYDGDHPKISLFLY